MDKFRMISRSTEIEVANVEGGKLGTAAGENSVNHELDKF